MPRKKKKKIFIGCTKHGVDKKLQSVERVHKLANGLDITHDALACAGCEVQLKGKCQELTCGHFSCRYCKYCKICHQVFDHVQEIKISEIDIQETKANELNRDGKILDVQLVKNPTKCYKHQYYCCIEMPCKITLCLTCIEEMAETTAFSTGVNDNGACDFYCICPCFNSKGTHIVSLCWLQDAAQKGQRTSKDRMTGKTNNETTSGTPVEEQIRYNMPLKTPDQEPVEMEDMVTEIVVTKTSQNKSNTGSESRTIEVAMESDELLQKRTFLKVRATGYCNNYSAHNQKAFVEFRDCSHRLCIDCLRQRLKENKDRTVMVCGMRGCKKVIPVDQLDHYLMENTSALGQENKVLEEQFATPRTVQESINDEDSIKAQKEQNTNKDRMTGKTNNETTSVTPVEEQIRYNMHRKTPDQEPVEMVDMGTEIVVTKTSQNKSNTGSESRTIEVEMEADELPQKRTFLKARATGYCNNYIAHYQKAFVEFRDCSHRLCIDCLRQRLKENKDRTVMVCGMRGCKKEIPVDQLDHYLMENEPAVCGNLRCNADSKSRMDIRWTCRKCKHKLCVICTSEQSTDINDKPRCMSATCQSSEHDPTTLSTGHLSSFRDQREILGIPNLGLTCYASCILQILGQTPDFKEYLHKYCHQNGQDHVDTLLKDLLENVNVGADGQFIINWLLMERLMHRIFSIDRSFRRFEENDCHSFIMTLFNALRKEDSQNETGTEEDLENISSDKKARVGNLRRQRAASGGKYTTTIGQDQCPAVLFESRLISKFTYKPCEHEEEVDDQLFRSILVPVQYDLLTLKEGVNMFFKGEEFPDNTLPCRSCNVSHEHTITTRVIKIAKAPKVLMLQLARFEEVQMAGSSKELRKTSHQVTFEKDLTLDQSVDGKELQYELYGVVIHTGSMLGGHYTSCVRKQQTNRWFYCSDSTVREIKEERIFQEWTLRNAYVLFYSRKT